MIFSRRFILLRNKTGASQVGATSKAQKAQNIFFGKNFEYFEKKILSENVAQCRKMYTEAKRCFATHEEDNDYFNMRIYIILIACVYIQQFNFIQ